MFKAAAKIQASKLTIYDIKDTALEISIDSDNSEKAGNITFAGNEAVINLIKYAIAGSGDRDAHVVNPEFASPRRFYEAWILSRELKDSQLEIDDTWERTLTDGIPELPEGALS